MREKQEKEEGKVTLLETIVKENQDFKVRFFHKDIYESTRFWCSGKYSKTTLSDKLFNVLQCFLIQCLLVKIDTFLFKSSLASVQLLGVSRHYYA